jgi:hypothetical protein
VFAAAGLNSRYEIRNGYFRGDSNKQMHIVNPAADPQCRSAKILHNPSHVRKVSLAVGVLLKTM